MANALLRAREKGIHGAAGGMLERAKPYLRRSSAHYPRLVSRQAPWAIRAYAAYTRKRAGDGRRMRKLGRLFSEARLDTIPLEADGWLLRAAGRRASAAQRAELLRSVNNRVTETAGAATFATSYEEGEYVLLHCDRRMDAVMLEALMRSGSAERAGHQDGAGLLGHRKRGAVAEHAGERLVLLALDRYFHTYERRRRSSWRGCGWATTSPASSASRAAARTATTSTCRCACWRRTTAVPDHREGRAGAAVLPRRAALRAARPGAAAADHGFVVERRYEGVDDSEDVVRRRTDVEDQGGRARAGEADDRCRTGATTWRWWTRCPPASRP